MTLHLSYQFYLSVQFSRSVVSDSLWPHGLQHARRPCPSSDSRSLLKLMSIESVMQSNHLILCLPLLLPPFFQSFPASGSFQMTQFFASVPLYKHKTERDLLNCLFQLPSSTEIPSLGFLTTRSPLLFLQWREHARFLTFFPCFSIFLQ